jgi:hypothetical protein
MTLVGLLGIAVVALTGAAASVVGAVPPRFSASTSAYGPRSDAVSVSI